VHNQFIGALLNEKDRRLKSLGYLLKDCKGRRTRADYDLAETITSDEAELQSRMVEGLSTRSESSRNLRMAPIRTPGPVPTDSGGTRPGQESVNGRTYLRLSGLVLI
jgi:hypothetical protein